MHKKTAGNSTKMYIVSLKKSHGYGILWCAYLGRVSDAILGGSFEKGNL